MEDYGENPVFNRISLSSWGCSPRREQRMRLAAEDLGSPHWLHASSRVVNTCWQFVHTQDISVAGRNVNGISGVGVLGSSSESACVRGSPGELCCGCERGPRFN